MLISFPWIFTTSLFFGHPYRLDPQHRRTPHASRPREKALEFGSALAVQRGHPRPKHVSEVAHV